MSEPDKAKKSPSTSAQLGRHVEELREEVDGVADSLGETLSEARSLVEERVQDYPYQAMAVAAVTGFVLGGGLTAQVGTLLLRHGGRVAARYLLRRVRQSL